MKTNKAGINVLAAGLIIMAFLISLMAVTHFMGDNRGPIGILFFILSAIGIIMLFTLCVSYGAGMVWLYGVGVVAACLIILSVPFFMALIITALALIFIAVRRA